VSRIKRLFAGGRAGNEGPPHVALRVVVARWIVTVAGGAVLAVATLPAADRLQDRASSHFGFDDH
jgi:hypothetical protein